MRVLQCVVMCCNVLHCVADRLLNILSKAVRYLADVFAVCYDELQCVVACYSVLQCVAVCCSVLQRVAVRCNVMQCVAV